MSLPWYYDWYEMMIHTCAMCKKSFVEQRALYAICLLCHALLFVRTFPQNTLFAKRDESALTVREQQVFDLASAGWPYRKIAVELNLSVQTVPTFISRARAKLGLVRRTHMSTLAKQIKVAAA